MTANNHIVCTWVVRALCPHCRKILTWRRGVPQRERDMLAAAGTIAATCPRHGAVNATVTWDIDRTAYTELTEEQAERVAVAEQGVTAHFATMLDAVKATPMSLEAHVDVCVAMVTAKRGVMADVRKAVSL